MLGVATIVVVGALTFGFRRPAGTAVELARAVRKDLVVSILCDGTLEPAPGGELRAPQAATVAAVLVREGQRVAKGTRLLELAEPELTSKALEARGDVRQLEAERARLTADVESARRDVEARRRVVESDRRLLPEKAIAKATLDADELALRDAEAKLHAAEAQLAALASGGGSRLSLAGAAARDLERRASSLSPAAPLDGIVYNLPRKVGEAVQAGEVVANVIDPTRTRVRARVDQPDLPRVKPGQRLAVTFDGLPGRRWDGAVEAVSPGVREIGGRQVGEVLGTIADSSAALPPNASVNVEIVADERKNALVVPRGAVLHDGEKRYVFTLANGRARRKDVGVGLIGIAEVEVTSGLADGETLILPGAQPLADGERVVVPKTKKA
jgi:multidrug efflux pump subunit AcrA (membrane-fusion protein)